MLKIINKYFLLGLILSCFLQGNLFSKTIDVKFGTLAPDGTPWADQLKKIQTEVAKNSKGKIEVKVFLGGQLGGEIELVQRIRRGQIQGGGLTMAALSSVIPELDVLELPYLFNSNDEVDYVLDKHLFTKLKEMFLKKGLVLVSLAENGWRGIGHKSIEVKLPSDLKSQKMRSQESKIHLAFWNTIEASPVAISIPEVLPSLQTGVVTGFDNTPLFMLAAEWHTSIKHYNVSNHIYQAAAIVYSKKFWDKLSKQDQEILLGEGNELAKDVRVAVRKLETDLIAVMKESGIKVHYPTKEEKKAFSNLMTKKREEMLKTIGGNSKEIYELVLAGIKDFNQKK